MEQGEPTGGKRVTLRRTARRAGFFYLLLGLGTGFGMGVVDSSISALAQSEIIIETIRSSSALFQAGCAASSLGLVAMLFLADALYELFEPVDRSRARLLVIFVVAGVTIALFNMVNLLAAIKLSQVGVNLPGMDQAQRGGLVAAFLRAYEIGGSIAAIFWGLWLFPFGMLILRSGYLPRILGFLLTSGCFAYLFLSAARLFFPACDAIASYGLIVPTVGEIGTIFWLLVKGAEERQWSS